MRPQVSLPVLAIALIFGLAACGDRGPVAPTSPEAVPIAPSVVTDGVEACGDPLEVELLAGQDIDVGSVTVANDEDNLYVTYVAEDGWTLRATHLEVAASIAEVPATQTGNPIVGRFSHQTTHDGVTQFSYTMALSDLGVEPGADLVVAAQADVYNADLIRSETAWGSGTRFVESEGNWATYTGYSVQECVVLVGGTITAGQSHSCALSTTGEAYCWGINAWGELGDGTTELRIGPVAVSMPAGVTFVDIVASTNFTVALSSTGEAYAWGLNQLGQLGDGTTTSQTAPVAVSMPSGVTFTEIGAGRFHGLALTASGDAYAWGDNRYAQLGDGTTINRLTPGAVNMPSGVGLTDISGGQFYSLALASTGDTYAWGRNNVGQLGDGTTTDRQSPVAVSMPPGTSFTELHAGLGHNLALTSSGDALAWGTNLFGQLGDGTTTNRTTPTPVEMPTGVSFTRLATGLYHSLALSSTGDAFAWGFNRFGQLGNGTATGRTPVSTPVAVSMPTGVIFTDVSGGRGHSLALGASGDAYGWGQNSVGQLGDGTRTDRLTPVAVVMPAGVSFE